MKSRSSGLRRLLIKIHGDSTSSARLIVLEPRRRNVNLDTQTMRCSGDRMISATVSVTRSSSPFAIATCVPTHPAIIHSAAPHKPASPVGHRKDPRHRSSRHLKWLAPSRRQSRSADPRGTRLIIVRSNVLRLDRGGRSAGSPTIGRPSELVWHIRERPMSAGRVRILRICPELEVLTKI